MGELKLQRPERYLLQSLLQRWDKDDALVLRDWCEERELVGPETALREALEKGVTAKTWNALNVLASCLGMPSQVPSQVWAGPPPASWSAAVLQEGVNVQTNMLGFPSAIIRRGETVDVRMQVQVATRVERIVFERSCTDGLFVENVVIGKEYMIMGDAVPARMFEDVEGNRLFEQGPVLAPGQEIRLVLENRSEDAIVLGAGAVCKVMF